LIERNFPRGCRAYERTGFFATGQLRGIIMMRFLITQHSQHLSRLHRSDGPDLLAA
jgi:hypothetical protein